MDSITLKTTQRGLIGSYINGIIWAVILPIAAILLRVKVLSVYDKYDRVDSFGDLNNMYGISGGDTAWAWIGMALVWIFSIITICLIFSLLEDLFYSHRTVHVLRDDSDDGWSIEKKSFGFPRSRSTEVLQFDRITKMSVDQGTWDRANDVGSLNLTLVTFVSGDSQEDSYSIRGIERPFERQEELISTFGGHKGLMVQLTDGDGD
jgi:hypothetical protein